MALTKLNFYVSAIFVTVLISLGLVSFGNEILNDSSIIIDNASRSYISNYTIYLQDSGMLELNDTNVTKDLKKDGIITDDDNETSGSSVTDFLATINWYSNKVQKIINYIKLVYNLPSFMLSSLPIPITPFANTVNIIGWILFIGLVILFIRLVRGS